MGTVFFLGSVSALVFFGSLHRFRNIKQKTSSLRYPTEDEFHFEAYSDEYVKVMNERVNARQNAS